MSEVSALVRAESMLRPPTKFTNDQVDLIKRTICRDATDDELKLFLYQAARTGLDPLARQIYSIERREYRDGQWIKVRSIQTSIDGFRLIAERSGKYAGQTPPQWCASDGVWCDVWLAKEPPAAARVGVLRTDFKEPCWGIARYDGYAQKNKEGKPTRMWVQMADVMISKCAEALALRKAFPQELSGLYTSDELMQIEASDERTPTEKYGTVPEDIVEHEIEYDADGQPIGIPPGSDGIERMGKAQARPEYARLQAELRGMKTVAYLMEWGKNNADYVASLPNDWQVHLRDEFAGKLKELKAKA